MPVEIEEIKCKGHGKCVEVCPESVFEVVTGKGQVVSPNDCTDCGACLEACPEKAIVERKKGMLLISEKINGSVKEVEKAIASRDEGYIQALAIKQANGGADFIDVNAGTLGDKEVEDMEWLVNTIQDVVEKPLAIDTTNVKALEKVLPLLKQKILINSVNSDEHRLEPTIPLVKEYDCSLVALAVGPKNVPEPLPKKLEYAEKIMGYAEKYEIPFNRIYFDPLLMPLSVDTNTGLDFFEAIKALKKTFPGTKSICGLSNVSFGLPKRKFLNQTFVVAAMSNGLDAAILDCLDKRLMLTILGIQALLGMDQACGVYKKIFSKMK